MEKACEHDDMLFILFIDLRNHIIIRFLGVPLESASKDWGASRHVADHQIFF